MDTPDENCPVQDGIHSFSEKQNLLLFALEMQQEKDREEEGGGEEEYKEDAEAEWGRPERGNGGSSGEDSHCPLDDILLLATGKACISMLMGRSHDDPCRDCSCNSCSHREVVMVQTSNITLAITIYYYKSVFYPIQGVPVVLHFTGSNCSLKCRENGDSVTLSVESFEKQKLECITKGDEDSWPFVFYMKAFEGKTRRFESANCTGSFLNATNKKVIMGPEDVSSFFLIQKRAN